MKKIKLLSLIFIGLLLNGCTNLKDYYYPYSNCVPYKVYKYECLSDSTRTQYWKMSYDDDKKYFLTEAFNYQLKRIEYFKEFIGVNGTELLEFSEVVDGKKQTSLKPTDVDVYKWNEKDSYVYTVKFQSRSGFILFNKQRKYVGQELKNTKFGEYNCVKFDELYTMTMDGEDEKYQYKQFAYYAKGFGMIKYERFFPDGETIELELTKVFNKSDWDELIKASS